MHAATLLTAMVTHGLVMPPVETRLGLPLVAEFPRDVVREFCLKHHSFCLTGFRNFGWDLPPQSYKHPWTDGRIFDIFLPQTLGWVGTRFYIFPKVVEMTIDVIDCGSEKEAKLVYLQLRMRRIPNYARSGRFLIKADQEAYDWFSGYYMSERYMVQAPAKPKAPPSKFHPANNPFLWTLGYWPRD